MQILFISNLYPLPWQPGRGVFNRRMVAALRDAGHRVEVVIPVNLAERRRNPSRDTVAAPDGAWIPYLVPPRLMRHRYHQIAWPFLRRALYAAVKRARPDVILAFWLHPDAAIAQRLGRDFGIPVVPMAGGSDLLVITRDPKRRAAVSSVLRQAPAVLTNGTALRKAAISLGAAPDRTHAFRRGVDPVFKPGDREKARRKVGVGAGVRLLVFVGNLVPVKGPDLLVAALAKCALTAPWSVAWIGDGPMRASIERLAHDAGIQSRMRFVGRLQPNELVDWYRASDLIALPSRSEGIPNVLLEAAACGTPFVAFDVGGVGEIDVEHAHLIPSGNVDAFAEALDTVYRAPARTSGAVPTTTAMVEQIIASLESAVQVSAA